VIRDETDLKSRFKFSQKFSQIAIINKAKSPLHWSPACLGVAESAGTMKFGHQFTRTIEATHPTISDKVGGENRKEPRLEPRFSPAPLKPPSPTPQFLCYKKLKKCLKTIPKKTEPAKNADGTLKPGEKRKLTEEQRAFVKTLNAELQKFNKFFMNAEEDLVIKDSLLEKAYREVVNEDGTLAESFAMKKYRKICQAIADFHGELVLMEHWVGLNYTALVKILKKHDKRSNLSLRSPFLVSVLQQPFYRTEVLSQLITKTETRFRKLNAVLPEGGLPVELQRREEAREHQEESKEESESDSSDGEGDTTQDPLNRTKAAMECWDGLKSSDSCKRPLGDIQSVVTSGKRTKQTTTE